MAAIYAQQPGGGTAYTRTPYAKQPQSEQQEPQFREMK
jgi:hypothetical protein